MSANQHPHCLQSRESVTRLGDRAALNPKDAFLPLCAARSTGTRPARIDSPMEAAAAVWPSSPGMLPVQEFREVLRKGMALANHRALGAGRPAAVVLRHSREQGQLK